MTYAIAPEVNFSDPFFIADCFIDVIFFADIVLNFRTGFYNPENEEHIILDPDKIFANYLEGWFPIDAVACLPIDLIIAVVTNSSTGAARYGAVFGLVSQNVEVLRCSSNSSLPCDCLKRGEMKTE